MSRKNFKYIYGPVPSWRLGNSLGIDLLSHKEKLCSFDCNYCQLGKTKTSTIKRQVYVPTRRIIAELEALPKVKIDYISFSGRGEPTLALNLGQVIKAIKKIRQEPIAVLTNSSLVYRKDVRKDLAQADLVAFKLDVNSEELLKLINRPAKKIKFSDILNGIRKFRKFFRGKLALQIMFMAENKDIAKNIAKLAKVIAPDEIQICTPIRPSPVKPLSKKNILQIQRYFHRLKTISLYTVRAKRMRPISNKSTVFRRGVVF